MTFEKVVRNVKGINSSKEYDIVLVNNDDPTVAVVEVKHKMNLKDIKKFLQDFPHIKEDFPQYKKYKLRAIVAGLVVKDNVKNVAEKEGLYVLTQSGDNIKCLNKAGFAGKTF